MDPSQEALIEEVIYLHSMWHLGPPPYPNPDPTPTPIPSSSVHKSISHTGPSVNPNAVRRRHHHFVRLRLLNPAAGLRNHFSANITSKKIKKNKKKNVALPPVSDIPWPCEEGVADPDATPWGWPPSKPSPPVAVAPTISADEQAKRLAERAQQNALKVCKEFFKSAGSDGEDGYCSGEEDDDDDDRTTEKGGGFEESATFKFFFKVLTDDDELMQYYEKNFESGMFCCLVCGATGRKVGKSFKGCSALIQHSVTILKTERRAHRILGHAICKFLGWDSHRLPTNVPTSREQLRFNLGNGDCVNAANSGSIQTEISAAQIGKSGSSRNVDTDKLMECNTSPEQNDAVENMGTHGDGVSEFSKAKADEGNGDCQGNGECANAANGEAIQTEVSDAAIEKSGSSPNGVTDGLMDCNTALEQHDGDMGNHGEEISEVSRGDAAEGVVDCQGTDLPMDDAAAL